MQKDSQKRLEEKQRIIIKKQGSEKQIQKDIKEKRRNMQDKGKMIITVEYAPNQGFSWRTVEEAAHFWRGYISQVRGHKVIDIETKYEDI